MLNKNQLIKNFEEILNTTEVDIIIEIDEIKKINELLEVNMDNVQEILDEVHKYFNPLSTKAREDVDVEAFEKYRNTQSKIAFSLQHYYQSNI